MAVVKKTQVECTMHKQQSAAFTTTNPENRDKASKQARYARFIQGVEEYKTDLEYRTAHSVHRVLVRSCPGVLSTYSHRLISTIRCHTEETVYHLITSPSTKHYQAISLLGPLTDAPKQTTKKMKNRVSR